MKAATFHNAVLTLTAAYAEALADLDAARAQAEAGRVEVERTLALARQAVPTRPKLANAARAVFQRYEEAIGGSVEMERLRVALQEEDELLRGGKP